MTTAAPEHQGPTASVLDRRHWITVAESQRTTEAGVFGPDARLELLEGELVEKLTRHPPHVLATDLVDALLHRVFPVGFFTSMGNPVGIEEHDSQPEPDARIVRGRPRDHAGRRRGSNDVVLAIEVSDSTYAADRRVKWRLYAASSVPIPLVSGPEAPRPGSPLRLSAGWVSNTWSRC